MIYWKRLMLPFMLALCVFLSLAPQVLDSLRTAYSDALHDPAFREEAAAQNMLIDPLSGEEVDKLIQQILAGDGRLNELVAIALQN